MPTGGFLHLCRSKMPLMCERCVGLSKRLSVLHHDLVMFRVMTTLVLRLGGESPWGGGEGRSNFLEMWGWIALPPQLLVSVIPPPQDRPYPPLVLCNS